MPFPTKIQPISSKSALQGDTSKPVAKSRLKRLFERRQFPSVLRNLSAEKIAGAGDGKDSERDRDASGDPEPSSECLDRMVRSFMEESNEKPFRSRCNCFHGSCDDSSDDDREFSADDTPIVSGDASEVLKSLVVCASAEERNLLADASDVVAKGKMMCKGKEDCRRIVAGGLRALGYNASVCKSRWEKSSSIPAGEYEYVDVIFVDGGYRLLVDVDFRSEFEIARSTKGYRAVLQSLPPIFVGREDRLQQIVAVVSEAARQSLRKKGLHFPPWRKPEYLRAKWLARYERMVATAATDDGGGELGDEDGKSVHSSGAVPYSIPGANFSGELEIGLVPEGSAGAEEKIRVVVSPWEPPEVKPKAGLRRGKVVAGLASVLREKPESSKF